LPADDPVLKGVLLRVGARIVLDWTSWAAIALAVVLAHSGIRHLDADAALLSHYGDAVGMPRFAYAIGALQLMAAAALVWQRTRGGACAALAAATLIAMANQLAAGRAGDALYAPLVVLGTAVAIGLGERAQRARQSARIRT
jgi:hypothetical protein